MLQLGRSLTLRRVGFGVRKCPSLYEFTFDTTRMVANLLYGGTLDRYPNVRLILSHAGGTVPYLGQALDLWTGD